MIRIAVVEDEREMLSIVCNYIDTLVDLKEEAEVYPYQTAEDFLTELETGKEIDVLLSDIELPGMDGIEFGKLIRQKYPDIYIVFLTAYPKYASDSYTLDAYQYILKKDMENRLPVVLKRLADKIESERRQYKLIGTHTDVQKIYYRDIIYIKKVKGAKYVQYITTDGEYKERIAIEQVMKELDSREFIAVDRSYIVNIRHIVRMKNDMIYLDNGEQVAISKTRFVAAKEQIHACWREL